MWGIASIASVPRHGPHSSLCRYVHGFRQKERSGASNGKDVEAGGDVEGKYTRIYEEGINPFKEFQVRGTAVLEAAAGVGCLPHVGIDVEYPPCCLPEPIPSLLVCGTSVRYLGYGCC